MKLYSYIFSSLAATLTVAAAGSLDGVRNLVGRRMPMHVNSFSFEIMDGDRDSFIVSDSPRGNGIDFRCTTAPACTYALGSYLKLRANVSMWWTGSRLDRLPPRLPSVGVPITGDSIVKYRYFFNTVTFSYTTVFWPFESSNNSDPNCWSYILDWLALQGVNMPLAWVGNEYILLQVYREVGLTDSEIRSYFSGAAFQSWNRLGNIQGSWGRGAGELPEQWITDQFALQKEIVQRMTDLGMLPVLPAFTGFVPKGLHTLFPNASIVTESQWEGFPVSLTNVSFLNPVDPLFNVLQTSFVKKQQEAYGNVSHFYALDQYNENAPLENNVAYLHNVSSSTIASLRAADPQAVWVLQAWAFFSSSTFWTTDRIVAYLGGIPNDAAFILDLYSEAQPVWQSTNSYFGKPWAWCELHGFGGNNGMEGNLATLTTAPLAALNSPNSSMQGIGLTMEGLEPNEIVYRLPLDQAWSSTPINVDNYVSSFVYQRYVIDDLPYAALQSWQILAASLYNNSDPSTQATVKSIYVLSPALTGLTNRGGHHPTKIFYNTSETIVPALNLLVQASKEKEELQEVPEFAFDVVNLTRQLLANTFINLYNNLVATYNSTNSTASDVTNSGQPVLDILDDMDKVLWTNENFLLSDWIRSARDWASNDEDYAAYLEYNARNQITLWGDVGEINDYAAKEWAGLVGTYYRRRWAAFVSYLGESKSTGAPYNATAVTKTMLDIGIEWDNEIWGTNAGETWGTRGDTWSVVDEVLKRWI